MEKVSSPSESDQCRVWRSGSGGEVRFVLKASQHLTVIVRKFSVNVIVTFYLNTKRNLWKTHYSLIEYHGTCHVILLCVCFRCSGCRMGQRLQL